MYLLDVYKQSKKSFSIVSDIEKIEKRAHLRMLVERSKTPESIVKRSIKNFRWAKDNDLVINNADIKSVKDS